MATANIHDLASLERVYSPDSFASDASDNDRPNTAVLKGVRIASAPDAAGDFDLEPASIHAGEAPGAVFLAPFHRRTPTEHGAVNPDPRHGYEAFLAEIVEAARQRGYAANASPGPGDSRIRGARQ